MYQKKKNEMSMGEAIQAYLEQNGLKDKSLIQGVIGNWGTIMGRPIAENTERVWYNQGIFYVKMNNPVWKNELNLGRSKIKDTLNKEMGRELINEVKII